MSLFMLSFIPPPQATATKRHHRHLRFKPLGCWRTGIFHCRSLTVLISINQAGYPDIPISHHPSLSVTGLTVTSNLPSQTAGSRPFQQLLGMFPRHRKPFGIHEKRSSLQEEHTLTCRERYPDTGPKQLGQGRICVPVGLTLGQTKCQLGLVEETWLASKKMGFWRSMDLANVWGPFVSCVFCVFHVSFQTKMY